MFSLMAQLAGRGERSRRLRVRGRDALIAVVLSVTLLSCSPPAAEEPESARPVLDADAEALQRLAVVEAELNDLRMCTPSCLRTLEELRVRFGDNPRIVAVLRAAYQRLEDWEALIGLEEGLPEQGRTVADRTQLASIYHRAGRYAEAASQLEDLLTQDPENADLVRRSAVVLFQLGDYEGAMERLDRVAGKLSGSGAAEAETLRGLYYFYRENLARAEAHLSRALELESDSVPALSGLARVLAAQGQRERAQEFFDRADEARRAPRAENLRKRRLNSRSRLTSDACVARSWDECERLIHELLAEANSKERVGIYRYLGQILTTAGRSQEAKEAFARSEELARQAGDPL